MKINSQNMKNKKLYSFINDGDSILLWDRDTIFNFILKFFTYILSKIRTPYVISLKIKFDRRVDIYRSATRNYIITPFNKDGEPMDKNKIMELNSFRNFMLMVDLFLEKRDEEYSIEDVEDILIEYWEIGDNKSEVGTIAINFNTKPINKGDIVKLLSKDTSNMHQMRVDIHPSNMDIDTWFINEKSVLSFSMGETTWMINRNGLIYTFMLYSDRYICTIMLPFVDDKNEAIVAKFVDVIKDPCVRWGGGSLNSFTRYYLKKEHAKNLDVNIIQKTQEAFTPIDLDLVDRMYVYDDGELDMWKACLPSKYIATLSRKSKKDVRSFSTNVLSNNPIEGLSEEEKTILSLTSELNHPKERVRTKDKIIALDLETRSLDIPNSKTKAEELEVISACWTNGNIEKFFYITDYQSTDKASKSDLLLKDCISSLLDLKFNNSNVYCHNLSSFDGVFLLKVIYSFVDDGYKVDLISKDSKLILISISKDIKIHKEGETDTIKFKLKFYDSLLILPVALSKLAPSFGVNISKLDTWDIASHNTADLNDLKFKEGLLNYNLIDCRVLHEVMFKFYKECKKEFGINILNCPTLPSIAFKLFRSKFLNPHHPISLTWVEQYNKLSPGYRGGAVDVYRPYGKDLFYYDINSLYPFVMHNLDYPIGNPFFFHYSTPKRLDNNIFGLVMAKIKAPDIKAPILLTGYEGKVIAPTGQWSGIYCTEELKNAVKYGYSVEVLWGYSWENKARVFKNYIETLYTNRLKYPKSDPKNFISKLMLNSLYGRFGLSPHLSEFRLLTDISEVHDSNVIALSSNKFLVERMKTVNSYIKYKDSVNRKTKYSLSNISLPMAMFVTAYARMVMSKYKVEYVDSIYYSDTDSIVLDRPLPSNIVSNTELGLFKLEHEIQEAVFIAPKVYAFITKKGEYICKIKGSKHKIDFDLMKSLLVKDSCLDIEQNKWYRSLEKGNITIKDQLYKLRATDNKREFVFNDSNLWVDTRPLNIIYNPIKAITSAISR